MNNAFIKYNGHRRDDASDLPSCPGNGDIYCIRFCNRMLTTHEIAYNYNIDRVRFRTYLQESGSSS